eukprot:6075208-Ditylum_brightwellii.AAC.1
MHVHQTEYVNADISPPPFVIEPSSDEKEVPPSRSAKDISRLKESMEFSQKGPKPRERSSKRDREHKSNVDLHHQIG